MAFPAQLYVFAAGAHKAFGDFLVGDGEFEFVALYRCGVHFSRAESALYHLALVCLEEDALFLEIVDVASVDASAVDEEETEENEQYECQNDNGGTDGDDFCFAGHFSFCLVCRYNVTDAKIVSRDAKKNAAQSSRVF